MTLFEKNRPRNNFHALKGVFRDNRHSWKKGSNFFRISTAYITRIEGPQLYAMICIREFPQRLEYLIVNDMWTQISKFFIVFDGIVI